MYNVDEMADFLAELSVGITPNMEKHAGVRDYLRDTLGSIIDTSKQFSESVRAGGRQIAGVGREAWKHPEIRNAVKFGVGGAGAMGLLSLLTGSDMPGTNMLIGGVTGGIAGAGFPAAIKLIQKNFENQARDESAAANVPAVPPASAPDDMVGRARVAIDNIGKRLNQTGDKKKNILWPSIAGYTAGKLHHDRAKRTEYARGFIESKLKAMKDDPGADKDLSQHLRSVEVALSNESKTPGKAEARRSGYRSKGIKNLWQALTRPAKMDPIRQKPLTNPDAPGLLSWLAYVFNDVVRPYSRPRLTPTQKADRNERLANLGRAVLDNTVRKPQNALASAQNAVLQSSSNYAGKHVGKLPTAQAINDAFEATKRRIASEAAAGNITPDHARAEIARVNERQRTFNNILAEASTRRGRAKGRDYLYGGKGKLRWLSSRGHARGGAAAGAAALIDLAAEDAYQYGKYKTKEEWWPRFRRMIEELKDHQ